MDIKPSHISVKRMVAWINGEDRDVWTSDCSLCPDIAFAVGMDHEQALLGVTAHTLRFHMPRTWWASMPMHLTVDVQTTVEILEENGDTVAYSFRQVPPHF